MKNIKNKLFVTVLIVTHALFSTAQEKGSNKVVITGVRFSYPLVEQWIKSYNESNPDVEVVIEPRTNVDPSKYDLLIEAYEQDETIKTTRDYLYVARYALLPVANSNSDFAKKYVAKGLTKDLIKQIYFNDIFIDKKDQKKIEANYTVYTRLQKAGSPITFSGYFGYHQNDIKGKAISGADEHLVKALLKDTTAVSYNVPGLLYNLETRKPLDGLVILPVDTDNNDRISSDEKFYDNLDAVIQKLETSGLKNIPTEYIHLSLSKHNTNSEALKFLRWVLYNGQDNLNAFGFLKPEPKRFEKEKEKFEDLASNRRK